MEITVLLFDNFGTLDVYGQVEVFGRVTEFYSAKFYSLEGGKVKTRMGGRLE